MSKQVRPLRGHVKIRLIRDLAEGARTHDELAAPLGVTRQAVTDFAARHADAIAAARDDIENELGGLWICDKRARLAEYQQDAEDVTELLAASAAEDGPGTGVVVRLYDVKHRALRSACEELGQLAPTRLDVDHRVRYEVVGVDPEALR